MCVDGTYLVPALVTLVSLAESHDPATRRRMSVCVLSPDVARADMLAFGAVVRRLGFKAFRWRRIEPDGDLALVNGDYISRATYLRFAFDQAFVGEPYFLYLDSDILVVGDLTEPFSRLRGDRVGAVPDEIIRRVGLVNSLPGLLDRQPGYRDEPYFNAGALWLSAERLPAFNEGALRAAREKRQHLHFNDQDALNLWALDSRASVALPSGFNRFELGRFLEQGDWIKEPVPTARSGWPAGVTAALHFIGPDKPWLTRCPGTFGVRLYARTLLATRRAISRTRVPMYLPTRSDPASLGR